MPNIPTYNAQDPESVIRIPDIAAEAWASAAKNIGRLGQEGAEATRRGFNEAAQGLKEFGQKLEQHKDAQDQLKLTNGLSDMELRHEQEIQALKTDPNISAADLPGRLSDTFQRHMGEMQQFGQGFTSSSDRIKEEVAKQTGAQRLQMFRRHEADASGAAGAAAEDGLRRNFNNTTAILGTNGTAPADLDRALATNENARQAALGTFGLNPAQREALNKQYDQYREHLTNSGIVTMLNKDPSQLSELQERYKDYITPQMRTELEGHARALAKQKAALAVHEDADSYVNQLLGGPPGQPAGSGQAPSGVGGPARGLGGPSKFVPPQPGEVAPGPQSADDPRGKIPVIRHYFSQNGINPDTAVAVARTEGLSRFENPDEPSFASFQLNMGGGLGNKFQQETGLDPRDPANEDATIKWTAENWRRNGGWEPFHGAANNGIGTWDGAQSGYTPRPTTNIASQPPRGPSPIPQAVRGGAVAAGDSISAGLIRHGGVSGKENRNAMLDWSNGNTAAGSSPPDMIAENLAKLPDETFKGRPVILSTGASNAGQMDPDDAANAIRDQIDTLKQKGATSITVLGVGSKVAAWNPKLEAIAKEKGVAFGGPIKDASDGIHPTNYRDFAHQIPIGQQAASGAPVAAPQIIDKTEDAGFGDRFGQLEPVRGMIIHHTAGGGSVDGVINTFQQRGFPAQFVIDRDGKVYQTLPDGAQGRHIITGSGKGEGLSNSNTIGVEIIANDDGDVLPAQRKAAAQLVSYESQKYGFDPRNQVFGHGEVNPGHKEPTEGMSVVNGIRTGELAVGGGAGNRVQYAQATPQTMTDAAPAGADGGGITTPAGAGGGGAAAPSSLARFPSREDLFNQRMSRMPSWIKGDLELQTIYEEESKRFADDVYSKYKLRTADQAKALDNELKNGLSQLEKGESYDYNEDTIRHYFEPEAAQKKIDNLSEAKTIGVQIGKIQKTSVPEILDTDRQLQDSLRTSDTEGFTEHNKMVVAYHAAAIRFLKGIGMAPGEDNSKADPAGYLIGIDPDLRTKFNQNISDPDSAQDYARSMTSRQEQLGIPEDRQHILPVDSARRAALQITGDPEHAAQNLMGFYHQWGEEFPKAWSDLVTQGRLPETYQLMATLDDAHDQFMLARGLSLQASSVPKPGAGETAGKTESFWEGVVGNQQYKAVRDAVQGSDKFMQFEKSVMASSPNVGDQVKNLRSAVETLAFSNLMFDPNITDAGSAASKAIQSAIGSKYEFLGMARVPREIYPSVSRAADDVRQNLNLRDLQVPQGVGKPGQPSADTWLASVRANPTWITNRTGDGIVLMDGANRKVIDSNGDPITLRFSNQRTTASPNPATTKSGAYDMTGLPF